MLNRSIEYAVLGLLDLAAARGERKSIKQIAVATGLPQSFLGKIFQKLSNAGIVDHKFGPDGGFVLAMAPKRLSLRVIFQAVDPDYFTPCDRQATSYCSRKKCSLRRVLREAEEVHRDFLQRQSLADLL